MSPDVDVSKNRFIINISVSTASKEENVRLVLEDVSVEEKEGCSGEVGAVLWGQMEGCSGVWRHN